MSTTIINFDLFTHNTIEITKRERTWLLRDDVPTEQLMVAFALFSLGDRVTAAIKAAEAEGGPITVKVGKLRATMLEIKAETAGIVAEVFRHTYPDTTDDEIDAQFSFAEMMRIMEPFFSILSAQLNPQSGAMSASSEAQTETPKQKEAPGPAANRAQRRTSVKHS